MKQEIWIAREKGGGVYLYNGKPERDEEKGSFIKEGSVTVVGAFWDDVDAEDITWENSPQRLFSLGCIDQLTISNRSITSQRILDEVKDTLWRTKYKQSWEDVTPLLSWCMNWFVWKITFNFKTDRACKKEARKYLLDQFNKWWHEIVR